MFFVVLSAKPYHGSMHKNGAFTGFVQMPRYGKPLKLTFTK